MTTRATPDAPTDDELTSRLRMVVTRLSRRLRQEANEGATPSQLAALATVERHGPITLGDLAGHERVRPPTMTRIVAGLEETRLVRREIDTADRRVARDDHARRFATARAFAHPQGRVSRVAARAPRSRRPRGCRAGGADPRGVGRRVPVTAHERAGVIRWRGLAIRVKMPDGLTPTCDVRR